MAAVEQRAPKFPDRDVKGIGMEQSPNIVGPKLEPMRGGAKKSHDVLMSDNDPFW